MLYTIDQQKLVLAVAEELKGNIEMPEWAQFVKTGNSRETFPRNANWWYIRAASILRYCHMKGPVGVSKLRTRYGGRKNRGMAPDKFVLASGKVIRVILQQLESAELLKQDIVGNHKGRVATPKGASLLVKAAKSLAKTEKQSADKQKPVKAPAKKTEEKPAKEDDKKDGNQTEKPKATDKQKANKPKATAVAKED